LHARAIRKSYERLLEEKKASSLGKENDPPTA